MNKPKEEKAQRLQLQFVKDVLDYLPHWVLACRVIWNEIMRKNSHDCYRQHHNTEVIKETQNVLQLGASDGCWWLHEASPCNCWKRSPGRWEPGRRHMKSSTHVWRELELGSTQWLPTQFTWISSFLFLFPRALEPEMLFRIICQGSRRQTPPESPSFFSSSSFNNLALRLFPFPDISGTYSSSLLLRTKTKDREGWAYDDGNASALNFCALMLQDGKGFNFTAGRSCMPSVYPQMDGTFYWARGGTGMPWYSRPLRATPAGPLNGTQSLVLISQ